MGHKYAGRTLMLPYPVKNGYGNIFSDKRRIRWAGISKITCIFPC